MATQIRIELLHEGFTELLNSSEISAECERAAQAIKEKAGDGFEVRGPWRAGFGGTRVAYTVYTDTQAARLEESNHKALTRAVHS